MKHATPFVTSVAVLVMLPIIAIAQEASTRLASHGIAETFEQRMSHEAAVIRATPGESIWQQIPWVFSVTEGQKLAQAEKRPIFLWMLDENPIERC